MPFFTIITVCRNSGETIGAAASSLLSQEFQDWEWIIVDGASTDMTLEILNAIARDEPRIDLKSEPDNGIYPAMNKGVRRAGGEYVYFLNADDELNDSGVLQKIANILIESPSIDLIYGDILVMEESGQAVWHRPPPPELILDEFVCGCLPHQGCFQKKSLFDESKIGVFNEDYKIAADYLWMMSAVSSPDVHLQYTSGIIAKYWAGGVSSKLEKSLPETFLALNSNQTFINAIGEKHLREVYQQQILLLRVELVKIRKLHMEELSKKELLKTKLTEVKVKLADLKNILPRSPQRRRSPLTRAWKRISAYLASRH